MALNVLKVKASLPDDSSENISVVLFGNIDVLNEGDDLLIEGENV